jgi:hypothetical protein
MKSLSKLLKQFKISLFKMTETETMIESPKILDPPASVRKMQQWNPGILKYIATLKMSNNI